MANAVKAQCCFLCQCDLLFGGEEREPRSNLRFENRCGGAEFALAEVGLVFFQNFRGCLYTLMGCSFQMWCRHRGDWRTASFTGADML